MGKIKGWTKTRENKVGSRWISNAGRIIFVHTLTKSTGAWERNFIGVELMDKDTTALLDKEFNTKKEATSFAIKYMRSHPNG